MIDSSFRQPLQKKLVDPLIEKIHHLPIHPSILTLFALFFGVCFLPVYIWIHPWVAVLFLWISGLFDVLDGSLARRKSLSSPLGAFFDIVSDRTVEFIVVLTFFLADSQKNGLVCFLLLGSFYLCVTTFLMAGIHQKNESEKSFHYSPGLIERGEAFIFFTAMALLPQYMPIIGLIFASLVFLTTILRLKDIVNTTT